MKMKSTEVGFYLVSFITLFILGAGLIGCDDEAQSCYSPTQNLETAYQKNAVGCACEPGTTGVCLGRVALLCENGSWQAVEDGPCMPLPPKQMLRTPFPSTSPATSPPTDRVAAPYCFD
jgi:uncharacterized membrane protein